MGRSVHAIGDAATVEEGFVSGGLISAADEELRETFSSAPSRPLRVLTLTPFFPSPQYPGQGGFIAEPLGMMQSFGISHQIIAVQPFYRSARSAQERNAIWESYFAIPGNVGLPLAGKFLAARLMPGILQQHRKAPFHVIHAHAALPCGHAAAIVSHRLSIPFVVSVHGLDAFFTRQAGAIAGNWCGRVAARVYRSAESVICISERVRQQVISEVPANTTIIYNGVDTEKFSPETDSSSQPHVLSVGNLTAIKGHSVLLRAFARLLREVPHCSLQIIGDGPERKRLNRISAELGIANRVHFSGRQSRDYVAEAMRRCAIFVLPSSYEGLGCVYLEAMACAKPAVGCRGQGIEEVIQHGKSGMLVTPESEPELSDVMLTLLRNQELRQRIGKNARAAVVDRFTLTHQSQQMAEVYRGCVR